MRNRITPLVLAALVVAGPASAANLPSWLYENYANQTPGEPQFAYSEAVLQNAPNWMKLNCHKRQHMWAAWHHRYSMCRDDRR